MRKGALIRTAYTVECARRSKFATAIGTIFGSGSTLEASREGSRLADREPHGPSPEVVELPVSHSDDPQEAQWEEFDRRWVADAIARSSST